MKKIGFDNDKYVRLQSEKIRERINRFGGKLYLEFGGKLFDDYHASRVLPGFEPDSKVKMLLEMKDEAEIVIVISADDMERSKRRGDLGITYDEDALRLIDAFRSIGLYVGSVSITHYRGQAAADVFRKRLEALKVPVYMQHWIPDYPSNLSLIVSDDGFGKNDYIETSRRLVVVTAPGPGSGKMACCLSQLYHEHKRGVKAGYAKFETFPIWNLPLKHPVNLAYEAATADLDDVNMIDPFHLEAYGIATVNYNRDVEIFPVLDAMFKSIYGYSPYKSPTDMGVNMAGYCIVDNDVVVEASKQEIIRRYYTALCNQKRGSGTECELGKLELLMNQAGVEPGDRLVVPAALAVAEETGRPAAAMQLHDGRMITGKTKELLDETKKKQNNAHKTITDIPDDVQHNSATKQEPVQRLKVGFLGNKNPRLHTDEMLIALSICAGSDGRAARALDCLPQLAGCEAHASVILSSVDDAIMRRLRVNLTCEPVYETNKLYHG